MPKEEVWQPYSQGDKPPEEVRPNGMGGEIPSYGAARRGAQTGGLGGEIPVQRSEGIMQEAGHRRGVSHEDRPASEVNRKEAEHRRGVSHGSRPASADNRKEAEHRRGVSHGDGPASKVNKQEAGRQRRASLEDRPLRSDVSLQGTERQRGVGQTGHHTRSQSRIWT